MKTKDGIFGKAKDKYNQFITKLHGVDKMKNTGLALVDIQNDYFPGGAFEVENSIKATENARALLEAFRAKGLPVIHIQHISTRAGATFFLPDAHGAEIHEMVRPNDNEIVLTKHSPNSFAGTALQAYLTNMNVDRLTVCGMMTQMCVDATVRAAKDQGYEVVLAEDACAARSLEYSGRKISAEDVHTAFVAALNGYYSTVKSSAEIIADL